jgi:hypothetical protein
MTTAVIGATGRVGSQIVRGVLARESANHNGLMSSAFVTTFLAMIGMTSGHTNKLWRSRLVDRLGTCSARRASTASSRPPTANRPWPP